MRLAGDPRVLRNIWISGEKKKAMAKLESMPVVPGEARHGSFYSKNRFMYYLETYTFEIFEAFLF